MKQNVEYVKIDGLQKMLHENMNMGGETYGSINLLCDIKQLCKKMKCENCKYFNNKNQYCIKSEFPMKDTVSLDFFCKYWEENEK